MVNIPKHQQWLTDTSLGVLRREAAIEGGE